MSVCPSEIATITCRTTDGAAVWSTSSAPSMNHVFNGITANSTVLGKVHLQLTGLRKEGNTVKEVNSTATTLVGFRLEDNSTTLTCLTLDTSNNNEPIMESVLLRVAGQYNFMHFNTLASVMKMYR